MGKLDKLLIKILQASGDANFSFKSICNLLEQHGFTMRIKGDHYIFTRSDVNEIINLQPIGSKAKAYQVKQIRNIFTLYKIGEKNV